VRIKVVSTGGDTFPIQSATYELERLSDRQMETSGAATIDGSEVYVLVTPQQTGNYRLSYTYQIANETLKAVVDLGVS